MHGKRAAAPPCVASGSREAVGGGTSGKVISIGDRYMIEEFSHKILAR